MIAKKILGKNDGTEHELSHALPQAYRKLPPLKVVYFSNVFFTKDNTTYLKD